ncbi:hypothetical protein Tco_0222781 [Tanacetum coccineum]
MVNLSEDIQSAGSDTRPPMLNRSDFASWQQRIRLYCQGKDNGENILKSIDEGPFKMGKFRETLAEGEEGALHLGPEQDRVFADLSPEEKDRVDRTEVKGIMLGKQLQLGTGEFKTEWAMQILNSKYFKDKMLLMHAQENGAVLDEEQLLFIAADQCDAFDSDVDEAPTAQTMFMANLSSADPIYDEAGPSYDSDILSEVQDHDIYVDSIDAEYTSDSNIIPYAQYVKDNAVPVVQSNVSSIPNDALMMIINDMHE